MRCPWCRRMVPVPDRPYAAAARSTSVASRAPGDGTTRAVGRRLLQRTRAMRRRFRASVRPSEAAAPAPCGMQPAALTPSGQARRTTATGTAALRHGPRHRAGSPAAGEPTAGDSVLPCSRGRQPQGSDYIYSTAPLQLSTEYEIFINATDNSTLPPFINAIEIFSVISTTNVVTDSSDGTILADKLEHGN